MAGLYLHIPFCASRCIYCGFYSTVGLDLQQRYVDALCKEMSLRPTEETITTIYLGGGTPSQLSIQQLRQLFSYIKKVYRLQLEEVTIECNPDDVTAQLAEALKSLPVNRVSMGVQTFDDHRLQFLHRRHKASQVSTAVKLLRQGGIDNISIDLIYGFPKQTLPEWDDDINQAIALNVEHLSAYALTYEEGTPLYRMMQRGEVEEIDEELSRQMYERLIDRLTATGFEHYEISNFAKPTRRSRHNSSYWQEKPYIGLGAAAHSFNLYERLWNVADIRQYINSIENGYLPVESESIDGDTRYNDRITVALRTCEGLDLNILTPQHRQYCLQEAQPFLSDGLLELTDHHLHLTRRGLFVSDLVMSSLMFV